MKKLTGKCCKQSIALALQRIKERKFYEFISQELSIKEELGFFFTVRLFFIKIKILFDYSIDDSTFCHEIVLLVLPILTIGTVFLLILLLIQLKLNVLFEKTAPVLFITYCSSY